MIYYLHALIYYLHALIYYPLHWFTIYMHWFTIYMHWFTIYMHWFTIHCIDLLSTCIVLLSIALIDYPHILIYFFTLNFIIPIKVLLLWVYAVIYFIHVYLVWLQCRYIDTHGHLKQMSTFLRWKVSCFNIMFSFTIMSFILVLSKLN